MDENTTAGGDLEALARECAELGDAADELGDRIERAGRPWAAQAAWQAASNLEDASHIIDRGSLRYGDDVPADGEPADVALEAGVARGVAFGLACPATARPCHSLCAAFRPAGSPPLDVDMAARLDPSTRGRCTRFDVALDAAAR